MTTRFRLDAVGLVADTGVVGAAVTVGAGADGARAARVAVAVVAAAAGACAPAQAQVVSWFERNKLPPPQESDFNFYFIIPFNELQHLLAGFDFGGVDNNTNHDNATSRVTYCGLILFLTTPFPNRGVHTSVE
ncbi:hypothetical protein DFH27DRAFT_523799 [Peziza echinospora]|nr:hypothetical protein DFH27DRAFT_523799 [Peziza echinospora]